MADYPRPDAIIFDVYDTLFENSVDRWQAAFAEIVGEQGLPISGEELWRRWKEFEPTRKRDYAAEHKERNKGKYGPKTRIGSREKSAGGRGGKR